jgi:hypothetical protein
MPDESAPAETRDDISDPGTPAVEAAQPARPVIQRKPEPDSAPAAPPEPARSPVDPASLVQRSVEADDSDSGLSTQPEPSAPPGPDHPDAPAGDVPRQSDSKGRSEVRRVSTAAPRVRRSADPERRPAPQPASPPSEPEPPGQPPSLVQRQVESGAPASFEPPGLEAPSAPPLEPPASPQAAEVAVLPRTLVQRKPADVGEAELTLEVPRALARRADTPPAESMAMTRRPMAVVQRAVEPAPQPRPEPARPSLPLAMSATQASDVIQRKKTSKEIETTSTESIDESTETPASTAGPNLQDLARRIYPILKRMLSIERERR